MRNLLRSTKNKWVGGVCGGIGEYANIDPIVIRILWIVLTIFTGFLPGLLLYLLLWFMIPVK